MSSGKLGLDRCLCGFFFALGCSVGCLVVMLCSETARNGLAACIMEWHAARNAYAGFASQALLCLIAMLCALSAFGYMLIPISSCLYGFCLSVYSLLLAQGGDAWQTQALLLMPPIIGALPVLRIETLCTSLSSRMARLWRTNGLRSFDLRPFNCSIWCALLVLLALLPLSVYLCMIVNS